MRARAGSVALGAGMVVVLAAIGEAQGPSPSTARVETAPLELISPERFLVPIVLEPVRKVSVMAVADGIVREISIPVGSVVRDGQEIGQLERSEAKVRLKIAEASVKEMQAELAASQADAVGKPSPKIEIAAARLDAAKARAELATLELDRCTLKAPFAGRLLAAPVSTGQYVAKGTPVAEIADGSILRALVPVDRTSVKAGGSIELTTEGKTISGRVLSVIPLPEQFAPLRELATPWAAAWVSVANPAGEIEVGQRVRMPTLPEAPVTTLASRAVKPSSNGSKASIVQVLRGDYVTNVTVQILGANGPERLQVTGPFRPSDLVITESSVPLLAGTLLRFQSANGETRPVEGIAPQPNEVGGFANIVPPAGSNGRVAPIGKPDVGSKDAPGVSKPVSPPAKKPSVPF